MSEVTATGMHELYPGVCAEGILYPHAHFSGYVLYTGVGRHSTSFTITGFPTPRFSEDLKKRTSRVGSLRFLYYAASFLIKLSCLIGLLQAQTKNHLYYEKV